MTVFSPEWFEHHQVKLLWLCNRWLTRRWFRWVLRIRRQDIGYRRRIVALLPHCYTVEMGDDLLATDFRTHPKFAKRIHHAFLPLWRLCHLWDCAADAFAPRLSFGFSSLTAYPDAGSGATTVDGYMERNNFGTETLAVIRAGAGNASNSTDAASNVTLNASTTSNQFVILDRVIFTFDTARLHVSSAVLTATLSVASSGKSNSLGSPDLHIASATPASNNALVDADYGQCGGTSFGSVLYASYVGGYNAITLDANGIANVSLTGISRFSARLSWDINNSFTGVWVSSAASVIGIEMADETGISLDPKLTVTYSITNRFTGQTNNLRPGMFRPQIAR